MKNINCGIKDIKAKGQKVIGCFPLYPPLELFHSLGLIPVTLWDLKDSIPTVRKSDRHIQPYACSVVRRLTEFLLSENGAALDGLFMYNACDTLRNLPEIIKCGLADADRSLPIFKIHIPMVPGKQTESSAYLRARIEALIQELEETYQVTFSIEKFRQSVSLYREIRNLCKVLETRVANGFMSYDEFSRIIREGWFIAAEDQLQALQNILQDGPLFAQEDVTSAMQGRVIVSGILPPPPHMIKALENAGLTIVGNDIASQNRALFYTPAIMNDPADYYVDFYHHHYPCTTLLYTADRRVDTIRELICSTRAQGLVFIGEKFCEFEYFEIPHLEKIVNDMGVQTLFLEVSLDDLERSEACVTRIETFSELMRSDTQGGRHAE